MHIRFNLSKKILAWYDNNRRNLPWRVGKYSKNKLYYRVLSEFKSFNRPKSKQLSLILKNLQKNLKL